MSLSCINLILFRVQKPKLHIFNNANLELLWDWEKINKNFSIELDRVYIHFNPKLCDQSIEPLQKIIKRNFTDMEVSDNGDRASCKLL